MISCADTSADSSLAARPAASAAAAVASGDGVAERFDVLLRPDRDLLGGLLGKIREGVGEEGVELLVQAAQAGEGSPGGGSPRRASHWSLPPPRGRRAASS